MAGVKGRSGRKPKRKKAAPPVKRADGFLCVNPRKSPLYQDYYERLYSRLHDVIKETDELTFNLLVQKTVAWIEASALLAREGATEVDAKTGRSRPSGAFLVEHSAFEDLLRCCALFGLAPKFRGVTPGTQTEKAVDAVVDSFINADPGGAL